MVTGGVTRVMRGLYISFLNLYGIYVKIKNNIGTESVTGFVRRRLRSAKPQLFAESFYNSIECTSDELSLQLET